MKQRIAKYPDINSDLQEKLENILIEWKWKHKYIKIRGMQMSITVPSLSLSVFQNSLYFKKMIHF